MNTLKSKKGFTSRCYVGQAMLWVSGWEILTVGTFGDAKLLGCYNQHRAIGESQLGAADWLFFF